MSIYIFMDVPIVPFMLFWRYIGCQKLVQLYCCFSCRRSVLGVLSLTLRQYLTVVACVLGLYAALLGLEHFQDRRGFQVQYHLFLFVHLGILLTWFALFGGFVSNIRRRLRSQKEEIKKANEEIKIEIEERKLAQIEKEKMIVELKDSSVHICRQDHHCFFFGLMDKNAIGSIFTFRGFL